MKRDLGTIFTLAGAAIKTAAPVLSGVQNGGRADQIRLVIKLHTILASAITNLKVVIQQSKDGVLYAPAVSQNDDLTLNTPAATGITTALAAAGTDQQIVLTIPGTFPFWKISLQTGGGDGQVGETITVDAQAI